MIAILCMQVLKINHAVPNYISLLLTNPGVGIKGHAPKPPILSFTKWGRNHTRLSGSWPLTPTVLIGVQLIRGHGKVMRSHEVTIHFSPVTHDRMEIESRKWCQTTLLVRPLRKIWILAYLGHKLALTRPDLRSDLKLAFQGQQVHVVNQLDKTNTVVSFSFAYLLYIKNSMKTTLRILFHVMTSKAKTVDLRPNLIKNFTGARRELIKKKNRHIYHTFGDDAIVCIKCYFLKIYFFCELSLPQNWADLKMTFCESSRCRLSLSNVI